MWPKKSIDGPLFEHDSPGKQISLNNGKGLCLTKHNNSSNLIQSIMKYELNNSIFMNP